MNIDFLVILLILLLSALVYYVYKNKHLLKKPKNYNLSNKNNSNIQNNQQYQVSDLNNFNVNSNQNNKNPVNNTSNNSNKFNLNTLFKRANTNVGKGSDLQKKLKSKNRFSEDLNKYSYDFGEKRLIEKLHKKSKKKINVSGRIDNSDLKHFKQRAKSHRFDEKMNIILSNIDNKYEDYDFQKTFHKTTLFNKKTNLDEIDSLFSEFESRIDYRELKKNDN